MEQLQDFLEQYRAAIALTTLAAVFAGFLFERFPPAVVAAAGAALFIALGFISPQEALSAFSNSAPITIGAMFVLSGALIRTGAIEIVATRILALAEKRPRAALASLLVGAVVASAFMNNTPVVLLLIPVMKQLAVALGVSPKRLLIPLSYAAILGGTCTLIGSSTNLIVDGVARAAGEPGFAIFEIAGAGLVAVAAGTLVLLVLGKFLLPTASGDAVDAREPTQPVFLTTLRVCETSTVIGQTVAKASPLAPRGVKVIAVKRGGKALENWNADATLNEMDLIIARVTLPELLTLANSKDFHVGLKPRPSSAEVKEDVVEIGIASSHVAIGRRLADIPFLSRFPVSILGVNRYRHLAGPDLASARLKAGDRLLVKGAPETFHAMRSNASLIVEGPTIGRAFRRGRITIAIAAIVSVVVLAAFRVMPIEALALIGVAAILVLRCVDAEEAWSSIDGNVLILIFAMLMLGAGLENTGAVRLLVDAAAPILKSAPLFILILCIYFFSSYLTETVTNNAVAVLMTPLAISISKELGVDPRPLIVAVMIGASASFATPIGYQTNTLVYAAGNYRFTDFLKIGLPMNLVVGASVCTAIYFLF